MAVKFGENLQIEIYGTSHGPCIGVKISGIPEGLKIDRSVLQDFLDRRAPGRNAWSTPRKEADRPVFLSGVKPLVDLEQKQGADPETPDILETTGDLLVCEIRNTNVRPQDYAKTAIVPRPGHADYPAWVKFGQIESGGGQFSARLTAALCIAGGIAMQWLAEQGIRIGAHVYSIGEVRDAVLDPAEDLPETGADFPVIDPDAGEKMKDIIAETKAAGDSIGGIVECMISGVPAGAGQPLFGNIESRICQAVFCVPAVKGIEFGAGFEVAGMKGSENNDPFVITPGTGSVRTETNNHGGILGGLASGMPIVFRTAMKPTPSIALPQKSVDLETMTETELKIQGRHDPCIVPRAVPCIEAAAAIAILDVLWPLETKAGLLKYRDEIDRIDRQVIELLEDRFEVVRGVGEYKRAHGLPVLDAAREQRKLDALTRQCQEQKQTYMEEILKGIMGQSRRFQADQEAEASVAKYGLLGRKLGHSHSPAIHKMLGGYEYGIFEREPEELAGFFEDSSWEGINVTIPYKREVMQYCDRLSETAIACNSVNTVVREHAETGLATSGHNTDYDGFGFMVENSGIKVQGKKTLVLGSGGVSGTVSQVMQDLGAGPVIIISRSGEDNYNNIDRHKDAAIIINTTPVGMYPYAGEAVIDITEFPACEAVYDLVYNPLRTKLMLDAQKAGVPAYGGLLMLVAQAAKAGQLFGKTLTRTTEDVYAELKRDLEHAILIGMPGTGKTSVGRELARQMKRPFIDLDEAIEGSEGRSPEEIIRSDGEAEFREIETKVLGQLLRENRLKTEGPMVLACGGGIVEREENRELICENGLVVWLERPLADLPLDGRPLSQAEGVARIYERRKPRYEAWSDVRVENDKIEAAAERIRRML